jgi:tetratricopeptide (TPR) repeat protein
MSRPDPPNPNSPGAKSPGAKSPGADPPELDDARKTVARYRALAADRPGAFQPDLARALTNLAIHLNGCGRKHEALAAIEEAVTLYRGLAAARPGDFHGELARALNNLAIHLSELDRKDEALAAIKKAVAIRRALAAAEETAVADVPEGAPVEARVDLAVSLSNMATHLIDMGRSEEALTTAEEAVSLYRRLAAARSEAFQADLARALCVQSLCLEALSQAGKAARCSHEAVMTLAPLFLRRPAEFAPLMDVAARAYGRLVKKAGMAPDLLLLAPITRRLDALAAFREIEEKVRPS